MNARAQRNPRAAVPVDPAVVDRAAPAAVVRLPVVAAVVMTASLVAKFAQGGRERAMPIGAQV